MPHKTLFIADLHLKLSDGAKWRSFVRAFTKLASKASSLELDAVYILGDLFSFFVGDDAKSEMVSAIREALNLLNAQVKVYFIRGNRDFLLGERFAHGCFKILPDVTIINLYGRSTMLMHGDLLCRKDWRYYIFRAAVQNRVFRLAFSLLPVAFREFIATLAQKYFKHPETIILDYTWLARQMTKRGASQVIYGHLHRYYIKDYNAKREICVPSWDEGSRWLVYNEDHSIKVLKDLD